uniref:Uncharacterized protein n=1 Tax=Panagrolaimus sp. JU765 TaxID=591449 RepID=A0AC34RC86_9BILA
MENLIDYFKENKIDNVKVQIMIEFTCKNESKTINLEESMKQSQYLKDPYNKSNKFIKNYQKESSKDDLHIFVFANEI